MPSLQPCLGKVLHPLLNHALRAHYVSLSLRVVVGTLKLLDAALTPISPLVTALIAASMLLLLHSLSLEGRLLLLLLLSIFKIP